MRADCVGREPDRKQLPTPLALFQADALHSIHVQIRFGLDPETEMPRQWRDDAPIVDGLPHRNRENLEKAVRVGARQGSAPLDLFDPNPPRLDLLLKQLRARDGMVDRF